MCSIISDFTLRVNWITCILFSSVLGISELSFYKRSNQGMSASNNVLKFERFPSLIQCVIFCDLDESSKSVQYNKATGHCVCHSVIPQSLDLHEDPDSNIYFNNECFAAESIGYIYDRDAHFCYKIHSEKKTWVDARQECVREGGVLAKLDTLDKWNLIIGYVQADGTNDYFIGGSDSLEDGVWRWIADNSTIPGYTMTGRKACLKINDSNLEMDETTCRSSLYKHVCEIILR